MSVAAEAVAFLGAEGLIMTGAAAYLGHQLVSRLAAPKQPPARRETGTAKETGTAAAGTDASRPPLAPVDEGKPEEAAA